MELMLLALHSCSVVFGALLIDFELAHHVQMHDFPFTVHEGGEVADQFAS